MFMLFEIWAEDDEGRQELVETTASETEAFKIAEQTILDGAFAAIVMKEDDFGDLYEVQRFEAEE
jgi:hypothetical protein